jgi:hypothetical protein
MGTSLGACGARFVLAAAMSLSLGFGGRPAHADVVVPVSLTATWRWLEWDSRSDFGVQTPASTHHERYLILRDDDTHEYWGRDSTGTYRITAGPAHVRDMAGVSPHAPRGTFLLEVANWIKLR